MFEEFYNQIDKNKYVSLADLIEKYPDGLASNKLQEEIGNSNLSGADIFIPLNFLSKLVIAEFVNRSIGDPARYDIGDSCKKISEYVHHYSGFYKKNIPTSEWMDYLNASMEHLIVLCRNNTIEGWRDDPKTKEIDEMAVQVRKDLLAKGYVQLNELMDY